MQNNQSSKQILLVGNPNVGKSTLFNALCNKNQKTGNYAGVTVSSHTGTYQYDRETVEIVDLPGAYSIYPSSEDELIFSQFLLNEREKYSGVVYVLDSTNLKRGLLLFQQIQDLGIPLILVANQLDELEKGGTQIDFEELSKILNTKIIKTNAKEKIGIDSLKEVIARNQFESINNHSFDIPIEQKSIIEEVALKTGESNLYKVWMQLASGWLNSTEGQSDKNKEDLIPKRLQTKETIRRYQNIERIILKVISKKTQFKELLTERIDKILVHKVWGYVVFLLVSLLIFQLLFFMAQFPMDIIEGGFAWLSKYMQEILPEGPLKSLIADGIIPGLGGVMVFAPQIGILLYLLYLLEDSGYMSRVVFLMDRFLKPFGLNGKSVVPLISGVACAVPAVMSARNIENVKERLLTILVTPFMTCSARLPIYSIIIALVIPDDRFLGIDYRAIALLVMYLLGFVVALLSSLVLKGAIKKNYESFLVLDLPQYKIPLFGYDLKLTLRKVWEFITGAGKIIFAVSIILWGLSYIGPKQNNGKIVETNVHLDDSYLAKMGRGIEPIFAPLGYDWKMGVSIITSFAAREVFVGTMATLYGLDEDAEEGKIIDKMRTDVRANGDKVFSLGTGISILLYYAFAMQCISTIAIVYRETKSWKWTLLQVVGMTGLAYITALIAYQILS